MAVMKIIFWRTIIAILMSVNMVLRFVVMVIIVIVSFVFGVFVRLDPIFSREPLKGDSGISKAQAKDAFSARNVLPFNWTTDSIFEHFTGERLW